MVYVDDDGKINPIQENSSRVGDLQTGATLLVSSNEFASIKEFRLQRRKYQWVEFRNVSLQPGYQTTVEVRDAGGPYTSQAVAPNFPIPPFLRNLAAFGGIGAFVSLSSFVGDFRFSVQ